MKNIITFTIFLLFAVSISFSQIARNAAIEHNALNSHNHQFENKVCGNILFQKENEQIQKYIETHPGYRRLPKANATAWNFSVGDTKGWWVRDKADSFVVATSTCRAVGENCYIFASDASWTNGEVTQDKVDELVTAFDSSTPTFPDKGIYQIDVDTFGEPPDFDGDDKIIIFLYDIEDDFATTRIATLGYFWEKDQYADGDPALGDLRSNEAEIFYIDTNPLLDEDIFGIEEAKNTLAHEFQHMIHYAYGQDATFVNEGLSEIAAYICGYGLRSYSLYTQDTNVPLLSWDADGDGRATLDYARASYWTLYLYEQFPITLLKELVVGTYSIWSDFDNTFRSYNSTRGFFSVLEDWFIANYANGSSTDPRYTYDYSPLPKPEPAELYFKNPNGNGSGTLQPLGVHYLKFDGGSDLSITFSGAPHIRVKALKIGSLEIEDVSKNVAYQPSGFGSTFPEVIFLVYNQSPGASKDYSYTATGTAISGTFELAYDDGEPEGYLSFNTGDSIAVWFDGIDGGVIDSIKTAFRRNGRIQIQISELDGQNYLRGTSLYGPAQVNSKDSTASTSPYPNPYDNWVTIDLSNLTRTVSASNDFVVSYLVGTDPAAPAVMVSGQPDDGVNHSRTYTENSGTTQWWIFHDGGTPRLYWNYLIRAYVRVGDATVAIDQNGIVTIPEKFSLEQNYPNPFNPSTTFKFATPKDGLVKFTIHDLLGREVYSESRNLLAGTYQFTWEGRNNLNQPVVSGVYFLKMKADGFTQTRKMSLLR